LDQPLLGVAPVPTRVLAPSQRTCHVHDRVERLSVADDASNAMALKVLNRNIAFLGRGCIVCGERLEPLHPLFTFPVGYHTRPPINAQSQAIGKEQGAIRRLSTSS